MDVDSKEQWLAEGKVKTRGIMRGILKYDKKSYSLKLKEERSIQGLPEAKEFVLNASYIDKTFMRNTLAYGAFRALSAKNHAPVSAPVHVFVDDDYRGLYLVTQRLGKNNLGVEKEGGFIFKSPRLFMTLDDSIVRNYYDPIVHFDQKYPKYKNKDYSQEMLDLLNLIHHSTDTEFSDPTTGVASKVDLDNVIDWELTLLMSNNSTGAFKNYYCYRTAKDSLIRFALWDCDRGFGRDDDYELNLNGFMNVNRNVMFSRLHAMNAFQYNDRLKARWESLKATGLLNGNYFSQQLDVHSENLKHHAQANFVVWPVNGAFFTDNNGFDAEVELIRTWVMQREGRVDSFVNTLQ